MSGTRKNVSLPEESAQKLEKLEEENFFKIYGGFSGWVQDEIDRVIKQTPKARLKFLKDEKHRKKKTLEKLNAEIEETEDVVDTADIEKKNEEEFFRNFFKHLERERNSRSYHTKPDMEVYRDSESPWIRKFRNQFSKSLRRDEFRSKVQTYYNELNPDINLDFDSDNQKGGSN